MVRPDPLAANVFVKPVARWIICVNYPSKPNDLGDVIPIREVIRVLETSWGCTVQLSDALPFLRTVRFLTTHLFLTVTLQRHSACALDTVSV
jgi:hypothetical protein